MPQSQKALPYRQRLRPFWKAPKIVFLIVAVLVTVSAVAAGMYYVPARPSNLLCRNAAVNYPSCDSCGSLGKFTPATQSCVCTNGAINPPTCSRVCANGAINPPSSGNPRGCDQCPDGRTVDYGTPCPVFSKIGNIQIGHEVLINDARGTVRSFAVQLLSMNNG